MEFRVELMKATYHGRLGYPDTVKLIRRALRIREVCRCRIRY